MPMENMWDIQKMLEQNQTLGNGSMLMRDPQTGEPGIMVPESKKEEEFLKKKLSPTAVPEELKNPKAFVTNQMPVSDRQIGEDNFRWDKEKIKELLNNEQAGIAQQEQGLSDFKRSPLEANLKPFAAFLDSAVKGGGKLAQSMPDADTPETRALKVQQLENMIQNQKGDHTKNALGLLQAEMNNQQMKSQFRQSMQDLKKEDQLRNDLTKSVLQPAIDDQKNLSLMDTALASGDYQKIGNTLSNYSRAVSGEKGVLTDTDIARVLPSNFQGSLAKFESYFSSTPTAEIPLAYTKSMRELIDLTKERLSEKYKTTLESKRNIYGNPKSAYSGLMGAGNVGDAIFNEGMNTIKTLKGTSSVPSGAAATPGIMSPEEFFKQGKK